MQTTIKTELITNYIKQNGLTIKEFCKLCNISQNSYYRIMNGKTNIRILTFYRILVKINVRCGDILICK